MDGFAFPVEVLRTNRKKSASIRLDGDLVKVSVPMSLSDTRIRDLVTRKTSWIKKKLKEQSELPLIKPKEYVSGETFPYLGKNYRLKVVKGDMPSIKLKNGYLIATVPESSTGTQEEVRVLLETWYRSHAEVRLQDKSERLAKVVGVTPNSISVQSYKSRWGSCSIKGDLTFNWKIILAPHRIVDYVVVHELCHLLEHNHSPRFWKSVERHVPEWKDCRNWLKGFPVQL